MKKIQSEIAERHRSRIIDEIIRVHNAFKLIPESLYLSINLLDRYLSHKDVKLKNLRLLGIACMFVASKYEEIYAPELRDFVWIFQNMFTSDQILEMEYEILRTLNFDILIISPLLVYSRLHCVASSTKCNLQSELYQKCFFLANYFLETGLQDYSMLQYSSSVKASSALFLSRKIMGIYPAFPKDLLKDIIKSDANEILNCSKFTLKLVQEHYLKKSKSYLKEKYSHSRFKNVADELYKKMKGNSKDFYD